ncbi:MAG: type I restriction endonuclease [Planctomycetota bacterium]
METRLLTFVENIRTEKSLSSWDEAKAKQGLVLHALNLLDWHTFDVSEVDPEYAVGKEKGAVDYCLKLNGTPKVFIEAKRPSEKLEQHEQQLLEYSFKQGVDIAILTNGIAWWFYLPLTRGDWDERKFYSIDLLTQNPGDIVKRFVAFLSRDNISNGMALREAESLFKSRQKETKIKQALPEAWNAIISGPDELLVELIADTTEKLCGFRPDEKEVTAFLSRMKDSSPLEGVSPKPLRGKKNIPKGMPKQRMMGKKPSTFTFLGKSYTVEKWKDILVQLAGILHETHKGEFDQVLSFRGRKGGVYFSENPDQDKMREPRLIPGSSIYCETHASANNLVRYCHNLLGIFGYSPKDLKIETK